MIKSFAHKGLKDFYETGSKKEPDHAPKLARMLDRLDASTSAQGCISCGLHGLSLRKEEKYMTRRPTHPGNVFLEDVMKPLNLTVTDAARMLGVSRKALSEFVNEKASLSPEMAIRISKATNTSPESWMNMQQKLTLWTAQQNEPSNVIPFPLDAVKEG